MGGILNYIDLLTEFILGGVATLGFAVIFNAPKRVLFLICVTGGMGRLVRLLCVELGTNHIAATYFGALAVGIIGVLVARLYRMPRTSFTVSGYIPLIPGVPAFTALLDFTGGNLESGQENAITALLIVGAIAMGLTTVRALTHRPGRRIAPEPELHFPPEELDAGE